MKATISKVLITLLAGAALAGSAAAQTTPPQGRHAHAASQEQRQAKMQEMAARRVAKLHDALQLSAAQEPAWAAFIAAIKPEEMAAAHAGRAAMKDLPAPQRLEKAIEMAKQHTAKMEAHLVALNTFYAVLTPAQQKVFDQQAGQMHRMRKHMGHH